MPRTEADNLEIKRQRRAQIMEEALVIFAEKGFHGASMSLIASACSISKGSLYNYFESKEQLLHDIIVAAMGEGKEIEALMDSDHPPLQKLMLIANAAFSMIEAAPKHWQFIIRLSLQDDIIQQVKGLIQKQNNKTIRKMELILRELGVERPFEEAFLIGATLDGLLLHRSSLGDLYPYGKMKAYFLEYMQKRYQS